ncbi:superinfection immunity protein [Candidatus Poriferisodalis sp.]|uniref:superinfection immunity protein n=1 Tax=Candidatus Poriferisodalis sp. TaxID=3101277 RepID=UPI003B013591
MSLLANLDGVNLWVVALVLFVAGCVYLLPSVVAASTRHRHTAAIAALNVLLGWTIAGWLIAFVWALVNPVRRPQGHATR